MAFSADAGMAVALFQIPFAFYYIAVELPAYTFNNTMISISLGLIG